MIDSANLPLLQIIVKTMSQPDGSYRLPDDTRIVQRACPASARNWWTVCSTANALEHWLRRDGNWDRALDWDLGLNWSYGFGFATPEEAYLAWLNWFDGVEEG